MNVSPAASGQRLIIRADDFLSTSNPCARFVAGLSLQLKDVTLVLGTDAAVCESLSVAALTEPNRLRSGRGGRVSSIRFEPASSEETAAMRLPNDPGGVPVACLCRYENGGQDVVYTVVSDRNRTDELASALRVGWPLVRDRACQDVAPDRLGEEAMFWGMSQVSNLATIVLTEDLRIVEANATARRVLASQTLFSSTSSKRLQVVSPSGGRKFREAVDSFLETRAQTLTVMVETVPKEDGTRRAAGVFDAPVTLNRYMREGSDTSLIVATIPLPPQRRQIDRLARLRGLTPAEARIAALLQQGLTNREVAERTGCSEETAKTYSKRVLSKLNVSRTRLAQVLTWQANGASA